MKIHEKTLKNHEKSLKIYGKSEIASFCFSSCAALAFEEMHMASQEGSRVFHAYLYANRCLSACM